MTCRANPNLSYLHILVSLWHDGFRLAVQAPIMAPDNLPAWLVRKTPCRQVGIHCFFCFAGPLNEHLFDWETLFHVA